MRGADANMHADEGSAGAAAEWSHLLLNLLLFACLTSLAGGPHLKAPFCFVPSAPQRKPALVGHQTRATSLDPFAICKGRGLRVGTPTCGWMSKHTYARGARCTRQVPEMLNAVVSVVRHMRHQERGRRQPAKAPSSPSRARSPLRPRLSRPRILSLHDDALANPRTTCRYSTLDVNAPSYPEGARHTCRLRMRSPHFLTARLQWLAPSFRIRSFSMRVSGARAALGSMRR
ncbi:hypothetical protein DFH06DRAFT_361 [Mycena polygramma]|nr:hypothetical protein DFH06DRAFT_361 [Mycena polygramma]